MTNFRLGGTDRQISTRLNKESEGYDFAPFAIYLGAGLVTGAGFAPDDREFDPLQLQGCADVG